MDKCLLFPRSPLAIRYFQKRKRFFLKKEAKTFIRLLRMVRCVQTGDFMDEKCGEVGAIGGVFRALAL